MANLHKTRTLFGFTSPRTIEKIIPEITLLADNFEGEKWNKASQIAFFDVLFQSEFYEGDKEPKEKDLAARDRITRAPKALGFIDLQPNIILTPAGKRLISGKRIHETITRQLLKFQLPSPYHKIPQGEFGVKPYLELLRLLKEVNSLSKTEIALFFTQLTHYTKFAEIVTKIQNFRANAANFKGSRKTYVSQCFEQEIVEIYAEDIEKDKLYIRQGGGNNLAKFINTKKANLTDYADAFTRYMRATQLVTFDKKTFRMVIAPSKKEEVNYILSTIKREPEVFENETIFKEYLFSCDNIRLWVDNKDLIINRLSYLNIHINENEGIEILKDRLETAEQNIIAEKITEAEKSLKNFQEYEDIVSVFGKITKKEVPDAPLYLEWNVWRAMVMLNYANEVKGNFKIDLDGVPFSTAQGNMPDISIDYQDFKLIVEVTMSSGQTQYNMEGEPVARHFGMLQTNSEKPVFCLFIAPKISEGTLAHFFNLNRIKTKFYGGKTRIIPFNLEQFIHFISVAKQKRLHNSAQIYEYLQKLVHENQTAEDEDFWYKEIISKSINTWL